MLLHESFLNLMKYCRIKVEHFLATNPQRINYISYFFAPSGFRKKDVYQGTGQLYMGLEILFILLLAVSVLLLLSSLLLFRFFPQSEPPPHIWMIRPHLANTPTARKAFLLCIFRTSFMRSISETSAFIIIIFLFQLHQAIYRWACS